MADRPEGLPLEASRLLHEIEVIASQDLLEGHYVTVGQNGILSHTDSEYRDSRIGSGLVKPNRLNEFFTAYSYPGELFHDSGKPTLSLGKGGKVGKYWEEGFHPERDPLVLAFSIERENHETGSTFFETRRDFAYFYDLVERSEESKVAYNDSLRGEDGVALAEQIGQLSRLKVRKDYLLDYLSVRKRALIIGTYFSVQPKTPPLLPSNYYHAVPVKTPQGQGQAEIFVSVGRTLIGRLDLFSVIRPPRERQLGDFGTIASPPSTIFFTDKGEVNANEVQGPFADRDKSMSTAYFKSEVLAKYESDSHYQVDDHGGVHYSNVWGTRGIFRLGDDLLFGNVRDIIDNLPADEWQHWKTFNVPSLSHTEHVELKNIVPIQDLANELSTGMAMAGRGFRYFFSELGLNSVSDLFLYERPSVREEMERVIKKTYPPRADRQIFFDRVLTAQKLAIDSLNSKLLSQALDIFDPKEKMTSNGKLLGAINLLRKIAILSLIFRNEYLEKNTKEIAIATSLELFREWENERTNQAQLPQVRLAVCQLELGFTAMKAVQVIRSKGAAHLPRSDEVHKALSVLGFDPRTEDLRSVFREILKQLESLFHALGFVWTRLGDR